MTGTGFESLSVDDLKMRLFSTIYSAAINGYRTLTPTNLSTPEVIAICNELESRQIAIQDISTIANKAVAEAMADYIKEGGLNKAITDAIAAEEAEFAASTAALTRASRLLGRVAGVVGMAVLIKDAVDATKLLNQMRSWEREGKITKEQLNEYETKFCILKLEGFSCEPGFDLLSVDARKKWIQENIIRPKLGEDDARELIELYGNLARLPVRQQSLQRPAFMDEGSATIIEVGYGTGQTLVEMRKQLEALRSMSFTFNGKRLNPSNETIDALIARIDAIAANDKSAEIEAKKAELKAAADALGINLNPVMVNYQRAPQPTSSAREV